MISFNAIMSGGWEDFKANPVLFIPGLLSAILAIVFSIVLIWAMFGDLESAIMLTGSSGSMDINMFESINFDAFDYANFALIYFVSIIIMLVLSSFISAGLTGMAKEVTLTGTTKFGDFFSNGFKYFFRMLLYTIAFIIILCIPAGFLTAIYMILVFGIAATGSGGALVFALLLGLLLLILVVVITVLFVLMFYFTAYAIVVDEMGVIDSFRKSYNIFKENKADVFIFVLLILVITFAVSFVVGIITSILGLIPFGFIGAIAGILINIIITAGLTALTTVWGVRMYYALTDETVVEEIVYEEYSEYSEIEDGILE
ncbi:hypothetical protein [Methanimicrococcus hongohii]|nr:hypothetical protein [Methanimicrococcus sp. Hf6]